MDPLSTAPPPGRPLAYGLAMGVLVDVASVRRVASRLADDDVGDDRELVSALCALRASEGWASVGALMLAVDASRSMLRDIATGTAEFAVGLDRAADGYQAADDRSAARIAATPPVESASW